MTELLPLDEGLWRAWQAKHRAKEQARAARRRKVILPLLAVFAAAFALVYLRASAL